MIGALITLIVWLIIAGVLYWGISAILAVIPLPEPIRTVINVILIVIVVLICIYALLGLIGVAGGPHVNLLR